MHNMLTNSAFVAKELNIDNNGTVDVDKTIERILGMHCMPNPDIFIFVLKFHKVPQDVLEKKRIPTKRELLCITMSVFEPFGFVADFMISIKLLMQEVGIGWDQKQSDNINVKFKNWLDNLNKLVEFKVPRFYFEGCGKMNIQLYIFCDASEEAIAVVAYWRIIYANRI